MSDYGRNYGVFRVCCSRCGNPLDLTYKPQAKPTSSTFDSNDGITGAAKVEFFVSVNPCQTCFDAAERPLRLLREALKQVKDEKNVS